MVSTLVPVRDPTDAAEARRVALAMASALSIEESQSSNLAIVVTEAAKNLLKHAGGGEMILRPIEGGVEMLAVDKGPGIEDVNRSWRDGFSTAGTSGTGLGAISRLSHAHDIYSRPGQGTVLMAQILGRRPGARPDKPAFTVGAVCLPLAGEQECGDDWTFDTGPQHARLTLADGLGHGSAAAQAARAATRVAADRLEESAASALERIHSMLRPTRGAAVSVAQLDSQTVRLAGLGNISGVLILPSGLLRRMVTQSGIAGHEARRFTEFAYPWERGSLLLMHSDGLSTHWSLDNYPGLVARHPSLIAAVLYRDHARGRDDVTVVALREAGPN